MNINPRFPLRRYKPRYAEELVERAAKTRAEVAAADIAVSLCNEAFAEAGVPVRMVRSQFGHAEFPPTANTEDKVWDLIRGLPKTDQSSVFNPFSYESHLVSMRDGETGQDPDEARDYVVFYLVDPRLDGLRVSFCHRSPKEAYREWLSEKSIQHTKTDSVQKRLDEKQDLLDRVRFLVRGDLPDTVFVGASGYVDDHTDYVYYDRDGNMAIVFPDGRATTDLEEGYYELQRAKSHFERPDLSVDVPESWGVPKRTGLTNHFLWSWEVPTEEGVVDSKPVYIRLDTSPYRICLNFCLPGPASRWGATVVGSAGSPSSSVKSLVEKWIRDAEGEIDVLKGELNHPRWAALLSNLPDEKSVF